MQIVDRRSTPTERTIVFARNGAFRFAARTLRHFGNVAATFGDTGNANLLAAPQQWSGMFADAATGLYDAPSRGWYDPQIGRYLTDAGGINGYRAFGNQPSNVATTSINWGNLQGPGPFSGIGGNTFGRLIYGGFAAAGLESTLANTSDGVLYGSAIGTSVIAGLLSIPTGIAAGIAGGVSSGVTGAVGLYGSNLVAAGGIAGGLNAAFSVRSSGVNASFGTYAGAAGLEGLFGLFNPIDSLATLGGGLIGGGINAARGGDFFGNGYLIGSTAGGIFGIGADDLFRGASRLHALGRTAFTGTVAGGVGLGVYGATGSLDAALFSANIASIPGALLGKRIIPCFPVGTPILTPDGSVPIEELQAGDLVLSRDEHNPEGDVAPQVIEETFVRHGEIYELRIGGQTIRVTPEHPLYVEHRGWTPAGELVAGDVLSTIHLPVTATLIAAGSSIATPPSSRWESDWLTVESNESTGEHTTVYNFRVAQWHTYFVGAEDWAFGLWVHNAGDAYTVNVNAVAGRGRERRVAAELRRKHPNASVQRERLLRDSAGRKLIDPLTGTGRRVDIAVIQDQTLLDLVEVTSRTAPKADQIAKENRIRSLGNVFIRDRITRELIPVNDVGTRLVRRK